MEKEKCPFDGECSKCALKNAMGVCVFFVIAEKIGKMADAIDKVAAEVQQIRLKYR